LLDTNVLSDPVRDRPDPGIAAGFSQHSSEIAASSVSWHEMWYGCDRLPPGRRRDRIAAYLTGVIEVGMPILPYDARAAAWHGHERYRMEAAGQTRPFADGQIAAIAATRGLVLVTRNTRDFEGFRGLTVVDWAG
jgi:tRNA(fMet)-specific endonuclease VapC